MPTTLAGIALYVFSLFPGIAFLFAREGHRPTAKRSVLRESATIVLVSTICDLLVALVLAAASLFVPEFHRVIRATLENDLTWARDNFPLALLGMAGFLAVSTALGFALGSKKVHDAGLHQLWDSSLVERDSSAWGAAFTKFDNTKVLLGIELKGGGYLQGYLFAFDNSADPEPHRTITLSGVIQYRAPGSTDLSPTDGFELVIVEAQDIEMIFIAYYDVAPAE
jgi:hypothetical protein